jgi:hypothetical protein
MTVQPDIEKFHIYADVPTLENAYGSFMSSALFQSFSDDAQSDVRKEKRRDIKLVKDEYIYSAGKQMILDYYIYTQIPAGLKQKDFMFHFPKETGKDREGNLKKQKASTKAVWGVDLTLEQQAVVCSLWNSEDIDSQIYILDQITRHVIDRYNADRKSCTQHEILCICNTKNINDWSGRADEDSDSGDDSNNGQLKSAVAPQGLLRRVVVPEVEGILEEESGEDLVLILNTDDCTAVTKWISDVEEVVTGPGLRSLINLLPSGQVKTGKAQTLTRF